MKNKEKQKLIIDCDTGVDDAIALIMALLSDEIEVVGISVCQGNTSVTNAYLNTKRILHFFGKDIDVAMGEECADLEIKEAKDIHQADGFGGIAKEFDREFSFRPELSDAVVSLEDFYRKLFSDHEDLSLIATGPLTNIARIVKAMPDEFSKLKRLVSMGGSYKEGGNVSQHAEFNYWFDPEAAAYVYKNSPVPVEMVGLDVSHRVIMTEKRLAELTQANPKIASLIKGLVSGYEDTGSGLEESGPAMHDPLAMSLFIDDMILSGKKAQSQILTEGEKKGACLISLNEKTYNSICYDKVSSDRFFDSFARLLKTT